MKTVPLGQGLNLNVEKLIETRLLIQASSGNGKSVTVRKILEETHGMVPHIVLDPDGEFSTLREKFDYILAGKGGDISIQPAHAGLLARRVLEVNTNIIVDLFELKPAERHRFVRLFLEELVNAPKSLWGRRLVVIDEAHMFCPEKGEGSSEAKESVVDLLSRGRKRGLGTILATQRLAKLSKDAAAECGNKLIGGTNYADDRDRAVKELGMKGSEAGRLLTLEPGQFLAIGRALSKEMVQVMISMPRTSHPQAGGLSKAGVQAPTAKVKAILAKLGDLPKEAELELTAIQRANAEVARLKVELAARSKSQPEIKVHPVDTRKIEADAFRRGEAAVLKSMEPFIKRLAGLSFEAKSILDAAKDKTPPLMTVIRQDKPNPITLSNPKEPIEFPTSKELGRCEMSILGFLSSYPDKQFGKTQVAVMSGYRHTSGGFKNAVAKLSASGLLTRHGDGLMISEEGRNLGIKPSHQSLESWLGRLAKCEKAIFDVVMQAGELTKDSIAESTSYKTTSGGFKNALARLNSLGLIVRKGQDVIALNPEVSNL